MVIILKLLMNAVTNILYYFNNFGSEPHIGKTIYFLFRMYYTIIRTIESHVVMYQKCYDPKIFMLWHDHL
jgi:hypothetical protein